MTSNFDSHTTTDVKPEILSGVKTRNGIPHDKYSICGIAHMLYIYIGVGERDRYIDKAHMALDIFRFVVFFLFFLVKVLLIGQAG